MISELDEDVHLKDNSKIGSIIVDKLSDPVISVKSESILQSIILKSTKL